MGWGYSFTLLFPMPASQTLGPHALGFLSWQISQLTNTLLLTVRGAVRSPHILLRALNGACNATCTLPGAWQLTGSHLHVSTFMPAARCLCCCLAPVSPLTTVTSRETDVSCQRLPQRLGGLAVHWRRTLDSLWGWGGNTCHRF